MRLRQFIAWAATVPATMWAVYGDEKSGQCATEEIYHSAAEMKRAFARIEAERKRDNERDLQYREYQKEFRDKYDVEMNARYEQATKSVHEQLNRLRNQHTALRDWVKKHGLWEQWKKERII